MDLVNIFIKGVFIDNMIFAFPKKVFSAIYTLTYLVWYISVAGGSVGISCCCRQLADGLAQYIYPHKFCIAHGLRLLLYMALISSNIYKVIFKYLQLR